MIYPKIYYAAYCDNCGVEWKDKITNAPAVRYVQILECQLKGDTWYVDLKDGNDHQETICPDCWSSDEKGNLIINEDRKKEITDNLIHPINLKNNERNKA